MHPRKILRAGLQPASDLMPAHLIRIRRKILKGKGPGVVCDSNRLIVLGDKQEVQGVQRTAKTPRRILEEPVHGVILRAQIDVESLNLRRWHESLQRPLNCPSSSDVYNRTPPREALVFQIGLIGISANIVLGKVARRHQIGNPEIVWEQLPIDLQHHLAVPREKEHPANPSPINFGPQPARKRDQQRTDVHMADVLPVCLG